MTVLVGVVHRMEWVDWPERIGADVSSPLHQRILNVTPVTPSMPFVAFPSTRIAKATQRNVYLTKINTGGSADAIEVSSGQGRRLGSRTRSHSQFFFLKTVYMVMTVNSIRPIAIGYPYRKLSSGIA